MNDFTQSHTIYLLNLLLFQVKVKIVWNDVFEKIGNFIILELTNITNLDNKFMKLWSLLTTFLSHVNSKI